MFRADEGMGFLLRYENVAWYEDGAVRILDRRIYPVRTEFVTCTRHEEVAQAIADMVTQSGGPYTAAAMGMALAAYEARDMADDAAYLAYMEKAAYTLSHARPTTVKKMEKVVERAMARVKAELASGTSRQDMPQKLLEDAVDRCNDNYTRFDRIAEHLADQIPQGGTIMTQCFAETIIGTLLGSGMGSRQILFQLYITPLCRCRILYGSKKLWLQCLAIVALLQPHFKCGLGIRHRGIYGTSIIPRLPNHSTGGKSYR